MIKKSFLFLLVTLSVVCLFSCKSDSGSSDVEVRSVNFLINDVDAAETRGMVSMSQLLDNPEEHMFYAVQGEKLTIEAQIVPPGDYNLEWTIDGNEWNLVTSKKGDKIIYTYTFKEEEAGIDYEVELNVNDRSMVKNINVVDSRTDIPGNAKFKSDGSALLASNTNTQSEDPSSDDQDNNQESQTPAGEDNPGQANTADNNTANNTSTPANNTSNQNTNNQSSTTTTNNNKPVESATPPPPPPPQLKSGDVNFATPSETTIGKAVRLTDNTSPSEAVISRKWDFGDGTIKTSFGKFQNYKYRVPGTYTITLTVNNDSKLTKTRTIKVKDLPKEPKKDVASNSKPKPQKKTPPPPPKPKVSKTEISVPTEAFTGEAVTFEDKSGPSNAIEKRSWKVNGKALGSILKKPQYSFDKAGTYTVELCLNNDSKLCDKATIVVKNKPVAPPPKKEDAFEMLGEEDLVGIRQGLRCLGENQRFFNGRTTMTLTPQRHVELESAYVFASQNGQIRVTLTDGNNNILENIYSAVNPGKTLIPLSDLGETLAPGQTYKLLVAVMDDQLSLEDAKFCNPTWKARSDKITVNYGDQIVLYDIRVIY